MINKKNLSYENKKLIKIRMLNNVKMLKFLWKIKKLKFHIC